MTVALRSEIELPRIEAASIEMRIQSSHRCLHQFVIEQVESGNGVELHFVGQVPADRLGDGGQWRVRKVNSDPLWLAGGGEVVGIISAGPPPVKLAAFSWDRVTELVTSAFIPEAQVVPLVGIWVTQTGRQRPGCHLVAVRAPACPWWFRASAVCAGKYDIPQRTAVNDLAGFAL